MHPTSAMPYQTGSGSMLHSSLLEALQHCEAVCEFTDSAIIQRGDAGQRRKQVALLRDCADICTLTAKYVARHSGFAKSLAGYCAQVCEICGNHCLQHPDELSQKCGQICLHCAQECRKYAM
ncbi:four-helix bundle copper-binding protein [Paenibacillus macerans]|uniref:four-helix bundle copper-binding protein n=1 Tax=Paenibacillus macerans TaxID=44252 RepID=UPI003D31B3EF